MSCTGNCAQGRAACPHPAQCQRSRVEQTLTDWGVLADESYTEPEQLDLPPMTRGERGVAWLIAAVMVVFIAFLLAGCGGGEPEDYFEPAVPPIQMSPAPPIPPAPTVKPMPVSPTDRTL